jgi:hypothetical protein
MQKYTLLGNLAAAAALLLGFSACSNEVDVIGEWKEIPIVYGILKTQDTATYIRIEKAFLPPSTDATQVAQIPDSIYFADGDITAKLYQNGTFFADLVRVDGALEGYPKDTGIFAQTPNILYKTRRPLLNNATYRLEIVSSRTGQTYNSSTETINNSGILITTPSAARAVRWSFFDNNAHVFNDVKFDWREPNNADIYDLSIFIKYDEFEVNGLEQELPNTRVSKVIVWKPVSNYIPSGIVERQLNGEAFYRFIARQLSDVTGTNLRRCARNMDVRLDMGGEDLALYVRAGSANQGVVGGLFPVDPYSNIDGGYGIFSSTYFVERLNVPLDQDVFRYLKEGELTQKLGFVSSGCP